MIAKLSDPFGSETMLKMKIDYHRLKIEKGMASVLFNSMGENHLNDLYRDMLMVSELNDRVKEKYIEISLNLCPGENLSDDRFLQLAYDYLTRMGYGNSCYAVIRHVDKEHMHVHVLATRIDLDGRAINDSFSHRKSQEISREIEVEYGLQVTSYNKFNNKALGEVKAREYYFHNALQKAMRSKISKGVIAELLSENNIIDTIDLKKTRTNPEYEIILGNDLYNRVGEILDKNNHFNPLYKDELLKAMDRLGVGCQNTQEFRIRLEAEGYYMRLITEKGQSYYVYGIPEAGIYLKDKSLPQKYRYGEMRLHPAHLSEEEQLHYIYNQAFLNLQGSASYEEYKQKMKDSGITVMEYFNPLNGSELSFMMNHIDNPKIFKAEELSYRLTYHNIRNFFNQEKTSINVIVDNTMILNELKEDVHYNYISLNNESAHHREEDDDLFLHKKKKGKKRER
jgi:hypothetical protein